MFKQLASIFEHSISTDNILALFHLWRGETTLKRKKLSRCFVIDSLESFHLLPISLRTHENSKHFLALEKKQNLFINTSLL